MHWRNSCLIFIILCSSLLPIISDFSKAELVEEPDDAPENVPDPFETHDIEAITVNACEPVNCVLNPSSSEILEIKGKFNDSEDKDVYWINSNSSNKNITYEVCINSSTVPLSIYPTFRNPTASLLNNGETLTSDTPATESICRKYPMINENYEEFWIKASSLSTSGNYSITINSQQIGIVGQEYNENSTHIMYLNKGVGANSSLGETTVQILNHSINEGELWNLEMLSDSPHSIYSICHMDTGQITECFRKNSSNIQNMHKIKFDYFSPEGIENIEIYIEMELWLGNWDVKNSLNKKGDPFMGIAGDAPGNTTHLQCNEENCKEFIVNTGLRYLGNMPLGVFDEADVWILQINGNEFDTFLVEIELLCEAGSILLEIHSPNSDGTMNITYFVPVSSTYEKLQTELYPGTHYIKLINIRMGQSQDWSYGDLNKSITSYEIQVKSIINQTNDNQTFEVSEELLFWDNILVWAMGIGFILPMIWVLFNLRKDRLRMDLLLHDKKRLARLRHLSSISEIDEVKSDLSLFIKSITNVNWEILLETWGNPDLSHITESMSVNSWKLDPALSNKGGIPILVIIETQQTDWEIAAIKFESKNNIEWNVLSLQPNLLYRNNEIFLDTIKVGNRVFLEVELEGNATNLQIHISGMSEGKPVAIKTPNSMSLLEEE